MTAISSLGHPNEDLHLPGSLYDVSVVAFRLAVLLPLLLALLALVIDRVAVAVWRRRNLGRGDSPSQP